MTVYLLPPEPLFPPVHEAEPDGLVAVGGDLSADRLLTAYKSGIFPWFMEEQLVFWYCPDPRMLLVPGDYKPSGSLARLLRSNRFSVSFDTAFSAVIRACAESPRPGQEGTWISDEFIKGYTELHRLGFAHSVEVFSGSMLVGGLYGVSLGAAFFGESMFFRMSNASKVAFHALVIRCLSHKFRFIDCQVETDHLYTLGAKPVTRRKYVSMLKTALKSETIQGSWTSD